MEVKANLNNLRMSPRKTRLLVDLVRGLPVDKALAQLKFANKRAAYPVAKLIESAIANGENTYDLKRDNLFVKEVRVDEGFTLKRWMPKAHGRATVIRKRSSKLSLVLGELIDSGKKSKKSVAAEAPVKLSDLAKEAENANKKESSKKATAKEDKKVEKIAGSEKGFAKTTFRRKVGK
ncbi:50S ribosomal protein L22 [Candidatus Falkowbacteria bacterium]|jgi:large subunit ribosomal protein L22|nr:50S ribosomal protein L22 [Candidatus Falkowbacteria bacterium]